MSDTTGVTQHDPEPSSNGGSMEDLPKARVSVRAVAAAIYRCREIADSLLLPKQQEIDHAMENELYNRIDGLGDADEIACDNNEMQFIQFWAGNSANRLNGTQQLALQYYRSGIYGSARLVSEVVGLDKGMAWALISHLNPTTDYNVAQKRIEKTLTRLAERQMEMRDNLNMDLSNPSETPHKHPEDATYNPDQPDGSSTYSTNQPSESGVSDVPESTLSNEMSDHG